MNIRKTFTVVAIAGLAALSLAGCSDAESDKFNRASDVIEIANYEAEPYERDAKEGIRLRVEVENRTSRPVRHYQILCTGKADGYIDDTEVITNEAVMSPKGDAVLYQTSWNRYKDIDQGDYDWSCEPLCTDDDCLPNRN